MKLPENALERDYTRVSKTVTTLKANIYALAVMAPVVASMLWLYYVRWGFTFSFKSYNNLLSFAMAWVLFVGAVVLFVIVHEGVHALVALLFCEDKKNSVKIGYKWKTLTPYSTCKEPLTIWQYRLYGVLPFLVTALLPFLISYFCHVNSLLLVSLCMVVGAGGDATVLLMTAREKKTALALDDPELCGATIYRPKAETKEEG